MTAPHADTADLWPGRIRAVARAVPAGASVIDLGAGAQTLKKHLSGPYTPADVVPRNGALAFDMEAGIYPEGKWAVAVMSGVLEYASDPAAVLKRVAALAPMLVLTYAHGGSLRFRRSRQWRNHLSRAGTEALILTAFRRYRVIGGWNGQVIYRAQR